MLTTELQLLKHVFVVSY